MIGAAVAVAAVVVVVVRFAQSSRAPNSAISGGW